MRSYAKIIILATFFMTYGATFPQAQLLADEADASFPIIRVAVLRDAKNFHLTIWGPYRITAVGMPDVLNSSGAIVDAQITASENGIMIQNKEYRMNSIRIISIENSNTYINKHCFRGFIEVKRQNNGKLLVINYINVEKYLYGVLYHEISNKWPQEVIKAQAVVARTFALYQTMINRNPDYDVTCDIYSQVYGGKASEKFTSTKAVDVTKGQILTYNGRIFLTYYHATCGGSTENAKNLWNTDLKPLTGIKCDFCKRSPHFYWSKDIAASDIISGLHKKGYLLSSISSINIESLNSSGRVANISISGPDDVFVLSGKDFRQMLGPNVIRSNNYTVRLDGGCVGFDGKGWGHGVGLCQWGAYFMSLEGYKYDKILTFYYPGSQLETINTELDYRRIERNLR